MAALTGVWGQEEVIYSDHKGKHQNIGRKTVAVESSCRY